MKLSRPEQCARAVARLHAAKDELSRAVKEKMLRPTGDSILAYHRAFKERKAAAAEVARFADYEIREADGRREAESFANSRSHLNALGAARLRRWAASL